MTVYIDDMYKYPMGKLGRMKMSHMIADTHEELMDMAIKIGLNPNWIQKSNTPHEHFDVSIGKRWLALRHGAKEITMKELAEITRSKRVEK